MRRSHRAADADTARLAPVLADTPVEVHNPVRKLRVLTLLFAAAIVLSAAASAYIATVVAYRQSTRHTDQRIAALEHDLAQRRAERAERDRDTQTLLEQYRHTICVLAAQHTGPDIDQLRADFHCPALAASPTPAPTAAPAPRGRPAAAGRAQGATRHSPGSDRAGEPPTPQPAPQPSPAPSVPPLTVCLPLLGCLD